MRFARIGEPGQEREAVKSSGKIICAGLNYRDHARETNAAELIMSGPGDVIALEIGGLGRQQTLAQA